MRAEVVVAAQPRNSALLAHCCQTYEWFFPEAGAPPSPALEPQSVHAIHMWLTTAFAKAYVCLAIFGRDISFLLLLFELTLIIKGMRVRSKFLSVKPALHNSSRKGLSVAG